MNYTVKYSKQAREDIQAIYEYIAFKLLSPETATAQVQRIYKTVRSLDRMPMRFRLYEDEPWHSKGLRVAPTDNYLVLYLPDEETGTVHIVRIIYGGRDLTRQLLKTEVELYYTTPEYTTHK